VRARRRGGQLYLVGLRETLRRQLQAQGLREPDVLYLADMAAVDALLNQDESG
jgi:anti-anti-sigma regulatory factor